MKSARKMIWIRWLIVSVFIIVFTIVFVCGAEDLPAGEERATRTNPKGDLEIVAAVDENYEDRQVAEGLNGKRKTLYVVVPVGLIRQEPSTKAGIVSRLYKRECVTVIATRGNWYRIRTDEGRQGWADRDLFSTDAVHPSKNVPRVIRTIRLEEVSGERAKIFIKLSGLCLPRILVLEGDRPRIVGDFYGFRPDPALQKEMIIATGILRSIRIGVHEDEKMKTRVVIDLMPGHRYLVKQQYFVEDNTYLIDVHKRR